MEAAPCPQSSASAQELIEQSVDAADLRILVMSLYHLTGDEMWLSERYAPARDVRLVADPGAGFDAEVKGEIRDAAVELLTRIDPDTGQRVIEVPTPTVTDPDGQEMQRMMSFCLGEGVPDEYVPMMLDDFGFTSEDAEAPAHLPAQWYDDVDHPVLIIGAGASGMCLAVKLDQLGVPYLVVEKNGDVGGTWFENRYPGCGVDTPNHFYSYSFAPMQIGVTTSRPETNCSNTSPTVPTGSIYGPGSGSTPR